MFEKKLKNSKFKYWMESEIYQQPLVLADIINAYNAGAEKISIPEKVNRVVVVASGSSYHCARFAVDLLERISGVETRAIYSSEFLLKSVIPHDEGLLYIFITQSGETSDTLGAVRRVKEFGHIPTLCITNKEGSSVWDLCDYRIGCSAGKELGIAATKSFTAQMLSLLIVALTLAKNHDESNQYVKDYQKSLNLIPEIITKALNERKKIKHLASLVAKAKNIVIAADGIAYSLAKEAALKIKETSYMNVNAAILGEFMHGHVAVLNNKSVLLYLSLKDISYTSAKYLQNIKKEYNPSIYIIGKPSADVKANMSINIECENELQYMFANVVICQLLALEIAIKKHRNPDKPHGLKKIVRF